MTRTARPFVAVFHADEKQRKNNSETVTNIPHFRLKSPDIIGRSKTTIDRYFN